MSYIDAILDRDGDKIYVIERTETGQRRTEIHSTNYVFYYVDPRGKFKSIYGDPLARFSTRKRSEFQKELRIHNSKKLFESDINVVFRCLSENYLDKDAPSLHTCFFDIEVDFDPDRGFSSPDDPFNKVTSITVYLDWLDQLVTLVVAPSHMSAETADEICSSFENTLRFDDEVGMFNAFFDLIEDADILTGWNSEGYDIPYMVNRVTRVMSKDDTRRFCLLNQFPKTKKYSRFGKEETTYELVGRVHLDYLQLYKKFNYEQRQSYKLDVIGELEVGERKTEYEGTLDQLYNKDFGTFITYNRQDVMLLVKIHRKLKFLELANQLAHENTVLLPTVMGSVAMIEQAVVNEAHARGLIVQNKAPRDNNDREDQDDDDEDQKAAGAYVAHPKKGLHEWVGAVDINSLYPSTIRALNMAPETIVGQLRPTLTDNYFLEKGRELASLKKRRDGKTDPVTGSILWEGLFGALEYDAVMRQDRGTMITIDWADGRASEERSGAEIWRMIFDSHTPWMLTANGTIFTYEREGVIPGLLSRWYSERKDLQKKLKASTSKEDIEFWDKRQLVKKILLNSAYGALLNEHCRFYDKRIGQSTTLNGRQIVKHMSGFINEAFTGKFDHTGDAIVYGDTDSCYFSAWPIISGEVERGDMTWDKETAIQIYDSIADQLNDSFPGFMEQAFHCPRKNGEIIQAGRELIATKGLFITKKRYAVNIYDKEGKRLDKDGRTGKMKIMGLEVKRADTPKIIQDFLTQILQQVLDGHTRDDIVPIIKEFKRELRQMPSWQKGSPKSCNKLTFYTSEERRLGRANMPGHVRGSMNWNFLREMNHDNYSMKVVDGMRIIVCKLKDNPLGFTSISYPTDELRLPDWFKELPFDDDSMEQTLVDEKLDNILSVLNWDLRDLTDVKTTVHDLFSFE